MSMITEVCYGYGIDASKLERDFIKMNPDFESAYDKIMMILDDAPMFREDYMEWLDDNMMELNEEGIEFCFEWEKFSKGLGEILKSIILEKFNLDLENVYDEESGNYFLMFSPTYPWLLTSNEKVLTEDELKNIFNRYSMILCNYKVESGMVRAEYCC